MGRLDRVCTVGSGRRSAGGVRVPDPDRRSTVGGARCLSAESGALDRGELADGLVFADFALNALLDGQQSAPAGQPARDLEEGFDYRIYQAQGMLSVQLGIGLVEAMTRLRAYALINQLRLGDVAEEVLSGTLQLDGDGS